MSPKARALLDDIRRRILTTSLQELVKEFDELNRKFRLAVNEEMDMEHEFSEEFWSSEEGDKLAELIRSDKVKNTFWMCVSIMIHFGKSYRTVSRGNVIISDTKSRNWMC